MASKVSRDVKILSIAFLLIFFGFGSIHSYTTVFFSDMGLVNLGFESLILIYLFFALSNPLSAVIVSRYGAKRCMIISSLLYSLYGFLILTRMVSVVYLASVLLGISASTLWTGQRSYVIRASDKSLYGTNMGFFNSVKAIGAGVGLFALGFMIPIFMFDLSFIIFSILPLIGLLIIFRISNLKAGQVDRVRLIREAITSPTVLRVSSMWFSFFFVTGLIIGIIPIQIRETLGIPYVGALLSIFHIIPILFSYYSGRLSDIKGRMPMIVASYIMIMIGFVFLPLSFNALFLVLGIVMIAASRIVIVPTINALCGDLSTGRNLEFLAATFFMIQNIGVVSALVISQVFISDIMSIYLISIIVTLVSMGMFLPLLRKGTGVLREQIAREVG